VDKQKKREKNLKLSIILSILLSIIFIVLILYLTVTPENIKEILEKKIRYEFFVIAGFLNFLSWCTWGLRLKLLANATGENIRVGWWESIKIIMANLFLAGITPSTAGGEPIRIYLLRKKGMSFGGSTASVLGERVLDAVFLLLCVPFAFLVFKNRINMGGAIGTGLTIGVIVFLIVIFLFFYAIKNPIKTKGFFIWVDKKISKFSKKKKNTFIDFINEEVDNFHSSMMLFLKQNKSAFVLSGFVTAVMWCCAWLIPSMILMGFGLPPFIVESFAAQVFLIIIIMMPTTPGSSGVTELGAGGLYSVILGSTDSVAYIGPFVLMFRFITYYMNLIVGAVFMQKIFKSVTSFSMDKIKKYGDKGNSNAL